MDLHPNLGPEDWPIENFETLPTQAEWDAIDDLAARGAFEDDDRDVNR